MTASKHSKVIVDTILLGLALAITVIISYILKHPMMRFSVKIVNKFTKRVFKYFISEAYIYNHMSDILFIIAICIGVIESILISILFYRFAMNYLRDNKVLTIASRYFSILASILITMLHIFITDKYRVSLSHSFIYIMGILFSIVVSSRILKKAS